MNTCDHTGCNSPQGECSSDGACMQRQPAKHFKPQSNQQREAVLRSIDLTEHQIGEDIRRQEARGLRYFPKPAKQVDLTEVDGDSISRTRLALNTWALYRRAGCGVRESFRNALRAYRSRA